MSAWENRTLSRLSAILAFTPLTDRVASCKILGAADAGLQSDEKLPSNYRIHNCFHVSLLKLYMGSVPTDLINSNKAIEPDAELDS
jgi:hypothetical protein